jgi:hypothetical protein
MPHLEENSCGIGLGNLEILQQMNPLDRYIKVEVKVDGEYHLFSIQREGNGELSITSSALVPSKIQNLIDDLWTGHAPSTL